MKHESLFTLPGVTHVRSSIVLKEIKSEGVLPIEQMNAGVTAHGRKRTAR